MKERERKNTALRPLPRSVRSLGDVRGGKGDKAGSGREKGQGEGVSGKGEF